MRRVRRDILADFPGVDITRCVVQVVHPAAGRDAVNGYEAVATYRPGSVVPEVIRRIRADFPTEDEVDTLLESDVVQYRVGWTDPR